MEIFFIGLFIILVVIPGAIVIGVVIYLLNKNKKSVEKIKHDQASEKSETVLTNVDEFIKETNKKIEETLVKRINFPTVGTKYEREGKKTGEDILKSIVNRMRKDDYFKYDKYEGMTNKEIKEESFGERVYELSLESVPFCTLEKEDDNQYDSNAIKVMVGMDEEELFHVGYVPKEHCKEIRELMERHRILIGTDIYGGKFKYVDYDDSGDEKIFTDTTPYGMKVHLSFWND